MHQCLSNKSFQSGVVHGLIHGGWLLLLCMLHEVKLQSHVYIHMNKTE